MQDSSVNKVGECRRRCKTQVDGGSQESLPAVLKILEQKQNNIIVIVYFKQLINNSDVYCLSYSILKSR